MPVLWMDAEVIFMGKPVPSIRIINIILYLSSAVDLAQRTRHRCLSGHKRDIWSPIRQ